MARVAALLGFPVVLAACTSAPVICDPACAPPRVVVFLHGTNLWTDERTAAIVCVRQRCVTLRMHLIACCIGARQGTYGGSCRAVPVTVARCEVVDGILVDFTNGKNPASFAGAPVTATITGGRVPAQRLATAMIYQPKGDGQCSCPAFSSALLDLGPPPAGAGPHS